jgi:uncharacterized protein YraI
MRSGVLPQGQGAIARLRNTRGALTGGTVVSHANRNLLAVAAVAGGFALSAAQAAAETAIVQSNLNLRSGPGPAFNVLVVLPAGSKVTTVKCTEEWCRVRLGRWGGYVSRNLLKFGADSYASAAPAPAPVVEPKPTLTGVRIWQWRDSEWRDRHWRRLEWHNRLNR